MLPLFFGLFGLIIGSFVNVLVLRYPEASAVGGRSACPKCGALIRWYDNIPLISFIFLRGRCRDCRAPVSWQYPIVEALTGALFALIGGSGLPLPQALLACLIAAILVAIALYDLRTFIIPDPWVYAFIVIALLSQLLFGPPLTSVMLLSGPLIVLPLFALWFVSRGAWMGFGDVKFSLGMGWLLGATYGLVALFFAFIVGAIVGVVLIALSSAEAKRFFSTFTPMVPSPTSARGFTMKSEIPFGPFLVFSTCIVWILLMYNLDPLVLIGLSH